MIFSGLTTPNWLSRWCPSTWWCPCVLNGFRSWFRTAHSSELYKATAPNVSYYDASTVNVQSNPTIKSWMVCLAYLGRDLWELLFEFMKLCVMNGQYGDMRNSARHPNLTLLWRREISWRDWSRLHIQKIDLHWAWKLGQVGWTKTANESTKWIVQNVFASCWNTSLCLGNPKESWGTEIQSKPLLMCWKVCFHMSFIVQQLQWLSQSMDPSTSCAVFRFEEKRWQMCHSRNA